VVKVRLSSTSVQIASEQVSKVYAIDGLLEHIEKVFGCFISELIETTSHSSDLSFFALNSRE